MPSAAALRLDANYRARLRELRASTVFWFATAWGTLSLDQLDEQFPGFVERVARKLAASQLQGVVATRAYVRGMIRAEAGRLIQLPPRSGVVGTSEAGTIPEGLAAIRPMVYDNLGRTKDAVVAMSVGQSLVERFADNEVTRSVDIEMLALASDAATGIEGWVGTTYGAVDECASNAGFHTFDESMVRHPHCKCDRSVAVFTA